MDDQNDILQKKILKREKTDTILAYIMLLIVLGAIGAVIYLKFFNKDNDETDVSEKNNEYININYISNELNNSAFLKKYVTSDTEFTSSSTNNGLTINYKNNDNMETFNINTIGNELEFRIDESTDKSFITDVYKETANIICKFYGNNEDMCKTTIDVIDESTVIDGIRFVVAENQTFVYLDTIKGINLNGIQIYNEVTSVDITDKSYQLKLNDITIKNIDIINNTDNIEFSGTVKGDDLSNKNVIVTIYNENNEELGSNEYSVGNSTINKFTISFDYDSTLTYDTIKKYSINVE